jgi:hypothetical protein
LHINPTTNELFWITKPRIKSDEELKNERITALETHAADTDYALMMGGLI